MLQAGLGIGNYNVTATIGSITANTSFSVFAASAKSEDGEYETSPNDFETTPNTPQRITWRGEIPTQKWMNFYSRVLSRFATDQNLTLTLSIEFCADGEVSLQKLEETKVALQELGLNPNVEIQ